MSAAKRLSLVFLMILVAGCSYSRSVRRRSDLMEYLYPGGLGVPQSDSQSVQLQLPLRLGIAFVPAQPGRHRWDTIGLIPPASEKQLLDIVRKAFQGREWVKSIEVIPSSYLMARGGFSNLDQVARLYNVEVIALASVDQIQHSDPGKISFLYLSIVGAYVLPLDRNDTRTLIDAAVFHIPSRRFLLRAPGVSQIRGRSTAVEVKEELRENSMKGMEMALRDLAGNLNAEVESFKEKLVAGERPDVDVVNRKGESIRVSGSFGMLEVTALALVGALAWRRRR